MADISCLAGFLVIAGLILVVFGIVILKDDGSSLPSALSLLLGVCLIGTGLLLANDTCPNCGEFMGTAYCTSCGASMEQEMTVPVCPGCGAEYDTDFCGDCGSKIG